MRVPRPLLVVARVAVVLGLILGVVYNFAGFPPLREWGSVYRLDLDVYRIGGRAFLDGVDLYSVLPKTSVGIGLPFTYPPLSAIAFAPMAILPLAVASSIMTLMTMVLLAITVYVGIRSLVTVRTSTTLWFTAAVSAAAFAVEPIWSTLNYGQINVVLMCLVTLDVLSKRTPWPRGVLIGFVTAIKLTPAVFVLYFLIKRDYRAAVVSGVSFLAFTALAFAITFSDSVKYWTDVLIDSDRIGSPAYVANQSLTGMLARIGFDDTTRTLAWIACSAIIGVVAIVAIARALAARHYLLALCVNAVLGLLISPVSWSHHWVWTVPAFVVSIYLALTRRQYALGVLAVIGVLLTHYPAHWRLGPDRWDGLGWPVWDQIQASSYVWWGVAFVVLVAVSPLADRRSVDTDPSTEPAPAR